MKNSELIRCTNDRLLTGLDKQRRLILREYSVQQGCPNCGTQQNVFEATGVDVDAWDCNCGGETVGTCSGCGRRLLLIVPFMVMAGPHWRWQLVPIKLDEPDADDETEEPELPELPAPWSVRQQANGRYAAFYGDGARRDGFYSPETAAQWVLDYLGDDGA